MIYAILIMSAILIVLIIIIAVTSYSIRKEALREIKESNERAIEKLKNFKTDGDYDGAYEITDDYINFK